MGKLEGKAALITGGARGIGLAIAEAFAGEGASVLLVDLGSLAEPAAARLAQAYGGRVFSASADVSHLGDCRKAVETAFEKLGKLDILVNNAGITRDQFALRLSEADWDSVLDVNLKGTFLMSQAALKYMLKQEGGRIISVSSVSGQSGNAGQVNYSASKSGIIGLTKSLARELAGRNILVNAVAPGFIETEMTAKLNQDTRKKLLEMIPLKRLGFPEHVARAVLFLAGPDSDYITGQVLAVNGGLYM